MSGLSDFLVGTAELLAEHNVAELADSYADDVDFGLVYGVMPQQPAKVICLTAYTVTDSVLVDDSVVAVQLRFRGDGDLLLLGDRSAAAFDVLQGLEQVQFGDLFIGLMWRQSGGPIFDPDEQRWQWADTYYARVNWPTANRTR